MKNTQKSIALWALAILMLIFGVMIFDGPNYQGTSELSFNEFIDAVQKNKVEEVTIQEDEYTGKLKTGSRFKTIGPMYSEKIMEMLTKSDAVVQYKKPKGPSFLLQFFSTYLPLIIVIMIFFWLFRSIQSGGGKAFSFGKSKAKLLNENTKKVTFKDVAGIEEAKDEVQEIIEFLKNPKKFTKLGAKIPKGVLLMGPPGTGKTLLAKAIAGEAGVPFFSISGSDFVEMFVGVGASRVRDLFEQGKKNAPCIVFIDEIDAVGRQRGSGLGGGHDEREQTLNQLLVEMDGFESNEGVIIVAATNRPDVLDPALLRPGRFDRRITVPAPDVLGREAILKIHASKVPMDDDVHLLDIARGTPGFTGADLANLVNEAALMAAHDNKKMMNMHDLEMAKDKVLMGAERRSMMLSDDEKKVTAYHEAGHTLVGKLIPHTDPVHKVTIIPRGRALGVTQYLPEKDNYSHSKEYMEARIAVMMGGRVAEELIFNQITTGAGNDIERATDMARKMVTSWGMSELGPLTFGEGEEPTFIGRDLGRQKNYSESTSEKIDQEIKNIIMKNYEIARKVLVDNMEYLHSLAKALIEYEILDGAQIDKILKGEPLDPPRSKSGDDEPKSKPEVVAKKEETENSSAANPIINKPAFDG